MMKLKSKYRVKLNIVAANIATEIFLIDSSFNRIGSGIGSLIKDVEPGYYKIRFRAGNNQVDELIEVKDEKGSVKHVQSELRFDTPVPLDKNILNVGINKFLTESGNSSHFLLFINSNNNDSFDNRFEVSNLDEEIICSSSDTDQKRPIGCKYYQLSSELDLYILKMSHGSYKLTASDNLNNDYDLFFNVQEGYNTLIFTDLIKKKNESSIINIQDASIHFSPVRKGLNLSNEYYRLTDLARIGLVNGRNFIDKSNVEALIDVIKINPMLGVYSSHMLWNDKPRNYALIELIIGETEKYLTDNPDLNSLKLFLLNNHQNRSINFSRPPSLKSSWDLIVRKSKRLKSTITQNSYLDIHIEGFIESNPWLLHKSGSYSSSKKGNINDFKNTFYLLKTSVLSENKNDLISFVYSKDSEITLTPLEKEILSSSFNSGSLSSISTDSNFEQDITNVLGSINAPTSHIYNSAKSLHTKLENINERNLNRWGIRSYIKQEPYDHPDDVDEQNKEENDRDEGFLTA